MKIAPVNNQINFKGTQTPKETGGGGKMLASFFVPGLGQFLDGRKKAGTGYMGAYFGTATVAGTLAYSLGKQAMKLADKLDTKTLEESMEHVIENMPKKGKLKIAGIMVAGLATSIIYIANLVDAYKGGKKADKTA